MSVRDADGFEEYEQKHKEKIQSLFFEKNEMALWELFLWMQDNKQDVIDEFLEVEFTEAYWKVVNNEYTGASDVAADRAYDAYKEDDLLRSKPHEGGM